VRDGAGEAGGGRERERSPSSGPPASPAHPPPVAPSPLLAVDGLTRHFGGVRALQDVSLAVRPGDIFGLIGPNGAGKTTLLNLLSGFLRPTAGTIAFQGRRVDGHPPERIARLGMRRTFQNVRLFGGMTLRENVLVGQHSLRRLGLPQRLWLSPAERRESEAVRARADALLERVGLRGLADRRADGLAYGQRRRLEIARALAGQPTLLLLDEPVAGVGGGEVDEIAWLLRQLVAEGQTIVLIEHNVRFVMGLCDRVAVLNFGRAIAEGTPAEVAADEGVIEAYLGRDG
jgi:ABC-type branched-subunit amino acid transport system ATPase component